MTTTERPPVPAPVAEPGRRRHFGPYGGRFVPEALVAALDELTARTSRPSPTRSSWPSSTGCSRPTPAGRRR
jgi:hypothetical protein